VRNRSASFFANPAVSLEIGQALVSKFGEIQREIMSAHVNPENTQSFVHGGPLRRPSATSYFDGGVKKHSSFHTVKFQDIVEHDVSILRLQLESFKTTMNTQFLRSLYATISDSCDSIGNVVDAKAEGSTLAAFEAMLEKLEIRVAPDGTPKLPEIHLGTDAFGKFKAAIEGISPEADARIKQIQARKIAEGWERELHRQAKFVGYGNKA
jgi:hypothetical protein